MNTMDAIIQRRSIRRFKDTSVPEDTIRKILYAATQAPSGKNKQPWHFLVVREDKRAEMVRILREGIEQVKAHVKRAELELTRDNLIYGVVDTQSVGAAIQNMLLAALELGLGTLWICDVFYAYEALCDWLGQDTLMIAAVSIGYPDESPDARPRQSVDQVTEWL